MGRALEKYNEWLREQERLKAIENVKMLQRREKRKRQRIGHDKRFQESIYKALDRAIAKDGEHENPQVDGH